MLFEDKTNSINAKATIVTFERKEIDYLTL
jgi:hypothetical protein